MNEGLSVFFFVTWRCYRDEAALCGREYFEAVKEISWILFRQKNFIIKLIEVLKFSAGRNVFGLKFSN